MTTRPKAKWKVEYDASVAAMSNAELLNEIVSINQCLDGYHDTKDSYRADSAHAKLTRLTESGFLPGVALDAVNRRMAWDALKPDDQAAIRAQFPCSLADEFPRYLYAYVKMGEQFQWVATSIS